MTEDCGLLRFPRKCKSESGKTGDFSATFSRGAVTGYWANSRNPKKPRDGDNADSNPEPRSTAHTSSGPHTMRRTDALSYFEGLLRVQSAGPEPARLINPHSTAELRFVVFASHQRPYVAGDSPVRSHKSCRCGSSAVATRSIRVFCHTMALYQGRPVFGFHTIVVSRWLVTPMAARSFPSRFAAHSSSLVCPPALLLLFGSNLAVPGGEQ